MYRSRVLLAVAAATLGGGLLAMGVGTAGAGTTKYGKDKWSGSGTVDQLNEGYDFSSSSCIFSLPGGAGHNCTVTGEYGADTSNGTITGTAAENNDYAHIHWSFTLTPSSSSKHSGSMKETGTGTIAPFSGAAKYTCYVHGTWTLTPSGADTESITATDQFQQPSAVTTTTTTTTLPTTTLPTTTAPATTVPSS